MPKLPRITAKKALTALLGVGFYIHHQTGSHINIRHRTKKHLHIIIPMHSKKDLALKTLKSIITQSELTVGEFVKILKG
ncbi:MAG: type II toxin-antitoxin system HicA family toxin [Candidatus Azambacteria bacterium]|nr:type II toxin-antitoxin system HicA family toxin [Candidatus Azambacteria bacterium]